MSANNKPKKEAGDYKTFVKGMGFCSFGVGSNAAAVDVKDGKIECYRVNMKITFVLKS